MIAASLSGMTVTILDGKQLKNVGNRLWPLRCKPGKVVGGKFFLALASWCAGSAIKRPCKPVPVTYAPGAHGPDASR